MEIPWNLVAAYAVFSFFGFYQKLHIKNYQGSSQGFLLVLNLFVLFAMLFGLGFIIYWGWQISWLQAIVVFIVAFAIQIIWFAFEAKLKLRNAYFVLSMLGFIAIPAAGIFMWLSLP